MKIFTNKIYLFCIALLCFCSGASLRSQSLTHSGYNILPSMPKNGEFNLSLGSQMFSDSKLMSSIEDSTSIGVNSMGLNLHIADKFKSENSLSLTNYNNKINPLDKGKYFSSVLTINTGFVGVNSDRVPILAIKNKTRKWHLKGKIERESVGVQNVNSNRLHTLRASKLPVGRLSENVGKKNAVNSKYYFETTYNFGEKLVGKLSYDSSIVDKFKTSEKIELEGTMKTNSNVLIKAGYGNEKIPEVKNIGKKSDVKIWTEFIMKF